MRALGVMVATLGSCMSVFASETVSPPAIEPASLVELPWTGVGHLDVPGFGSLINIGFVAGQYPQPPTLSGSTLFVPGGTYTTSLVIVDLSDQTHPVLVTDYTGISTREVAVQGTLLYSVDGYNRFSILDISDLTHPRVLGSLSFNPSGLGAATESVAVAGSVAYVTGGGPFLANFPALQMIDVSNPASPKPLGASAESGGADVVVRDGYAYVAAYDAGLRIYDVTSGKAPTLVATAGTLGQAGQVRLAGSYAYVLNGGFEYSLTIVDVTDPAHPATVGAVAVPSSFACFDFCENSYFQGIAVSGHIVYVSGARGLLAVDVADPAHPAVTGRFAPDTYTGGAAAYGGAIVSVNAIGVDVVRLGARPVAVAMPGLDAEGHLLLDGSGSHDDDGQVVSYDWSLHAHDPQGAGYVFSGMTVSLRDVAPGVYDAALTVHDDSGMASQPAVLPVAVPSHAAEEELAACQDQLAGFEDRITGLDLDLQEGSAGLAEIEALLLTPPGLRHSTNHYDRALGDELNRIIEILLAHRGNRTAGPTVSRIPVQPSR
jgi:hypothetical protein